MTSPVRVGIVGTGRIAPSHVAGARAAGAEVVAVAGADATRAAAFASRLGIPHAADVVSLIDDTEIDVVHVAGRNVDNVRTAALALDAGRHLVMEKPVGLSVADADRLVLAAERSGVQTMTCFTYLGQDGVQLARQRVLDGSAGAITTIRAHYLQDWMVFEPAPDWRVDPAIAGPGGALADIGTHVFSLVESITGETITALSCRSTDRDGPPLVASLLIELSNGAVGTIAISQRALGHDNDLRIEIDGDNETLVWSADQPHQVEVAHPGDGGPEWTVVAGEPAADPLANLLRGFYASVAGDQASAPHPTLAFGARSTAFVHAALESAETGASVALPGS